MTEHLAVEVDTLRFCGQVGDVQQPTEGLYTERRTMEAGTGVIVSSAFSRTLPSGARLSARRGRTGAMVCSVEASLPAVNQGLNYPAVSLVDGIRLARSLYEEAGESVGWETDFDDLLVRRIDLVRDFADVTDLSHLVRHWGSLPVAYERTRGRPMTYPGSQKTGTSFYRGPRQTSYVCVYDKHHWEANLGSRKGNIPRGTTRYEARYRTPALQRLGISRIADLDEERLEQARRHLWDKYSLGSRVAFGSSVLRVLEESDLTVIAKRNTLWVVSCAAEGRPHGLNRATARKAQMNAQRLGLTVEDVFNLDRTIRLDYEQGRQVTEFRARPERPARSFLLQRVAADEMAG